MPLIRLAGCDPGKTRDSFALVSLLVNPEENEIFIEFCKRWLRVDYLNVEADIARMNQKALWNHIYVEQNNTGEHVIEVLRKKYGLPVKPITTVAKLTDPKKHHKGKTMSKNEMVGWFLKAKQSHIIQFPQDSKNPDMLEYIRQIAIFSEHKTEAGNVAYYAPGEEHDDLVMAGLVACYAARRYIRVTGAPAGGVVGGTLLDRKQNQNTAAGILEAGMYDEFMV